MDVYDFPYNSIQLGFSSSQLTFTPSFLRGVGIPPTSYPFSGDDPFVVTSGVSGL
jgi:hypothetical protein